MLDEEEFRRILLDELNMPAYSYKPWFPETPTWSTSTTVDCTGTEALLKALEPLTSTPLPDLDFSKITLPDPDFSQLLTPSPIIYPSVRIYTQERGDNVATYWKQSINWNDPNNALGGVKVSETQELSIRCTKEEKEQVIKLAEEKWETCMFESGCDPQDDYDCRKCLERRIRWEIDGDTSKP